ncbi:MAG: hypothetical protein L0Y71_24725 [Gemmataceae bacterium]|nr:hypothetical protein [Gemmataceae bacterium]
MERWQRVWREGLVPRLSRRSLQALKTALLRDDPRLIQKRTMTPPPLLGLHDAEVEAACALGLCGWQGDGCATVGALEAYFDELCTAADEALGEPAACRHFLDWFDATPRYTMRRLLLAEVEHALDNTPTPVAA